MFIIVLFRAVVVVDFFFNDEMYVLPIKKVTNHCSIVMETSRLFHTLDGKYESFGFYSIYGFSAMMPVFWTLQTHYLTKHRTETSLPVWIANIVIFVAIWSLRFFADRQKMRLSRTQEKCLFWGRQTQEIPVSYQKRDGKPHRSLLLFSSTSMSSCELSQNNLWGSLLKFQSAGLWA